MLNVPVQGMEETVLAIGGCSGRDVDKFAELEINVCKPGWDTWCGFIKESSPDCSLVPRKRCKKRELERRALDARLRSMVALECCVAHVPAYVNKIDEVNGHYLFQCKILCAFVRPEYWGGKLFCPQRPEVPPFLTFFGSKTFGYVHCAASSTKIRDSITNESKISSASTIGTMVGENPMAEVGATAE